MTNFPKPLRPGDLIAITAPSSGVAPGQHARLDLVLAHLRALGYQVVEGECLREQHKDASAPREKRARELMRFLSDPAVSAVMPPWGGELAIELLELIDFDALKQIEPKWFLGFSDLSTLQMPLTLISGWATAHGSNLMDLAPTQTDPLTSSVLSVLASDWDAPVLQRSSTRYQKTRTPFEVRADAPLNLTEPTLWRRLDGSNDSIEFDGRLIGGCLDTIVCLAGSKFGDVPRYVRGCADEGAILYLENCELNPANLLRALWCLKLNGWFEGLSGLLIGRSAGPVPESANSLS